jgi:hypothetical protein
MRPWATPKDAPPICHVGLRLTVDSMRYIAHDLNYAGSYVIFERVDPSLLAVPGPVAQAVEHLPFKLPLNGKLPPVSAYILWGFLSSEKIQEQLFWR